MHLTGVFAPLPTPFDDRGDVDLPRLRRALPHWVASPLAGFVVLGTNGEIGLMEDGECDRVIETARALALGDDAVLVRTPSLFKAQMTSAALIDHYRAVADASPVPVLLYNFTAA